MEKREYRNIGIDILKAFSAFLVIYIHTPFPYEIGQYLVSMARVAVPIFFMISGYFYLNIVGRKGEERQIKKIFKIFILSNILYFFIKVVFETLIGNGFLSYILKVFSKESIFNFIVFNVSPFNGHLWYLGAILYVLIITYIFDRLKLKKILYILTPIFLIIDIIFGKYSLAIFGREFLYIYLRNFIITGLPYFYIGRIIKENQIRIKNYVAILGIFIFSSTLIFERYILKFYNLNAERDSFISVIFLAIIIFLFFTSFYDDEKGQFKLSKLEIALANVGRRYSLLIYIIHPIFILLLKPIIFRLGVYKYYQFISAIIIFILCILLIKMVKEVFKLINIKFNLKN